MSVPSVSVILPTYNRAIVLERAIGDVLKQTYTDLELIIIDSGTDDAEKIVAGFDDDRISYYWQEPRGLGAARNLGIEKARADVVAFQDDDDEWQPEKLARQMAVFEQAPPEVGVVYTGVWKVEDGERHYVPGEKVQPKEGDVHEALLPYNFVSPQTVAARKRCFDLVGGFNETLPALEDWEMWLRISREFEFRYLDEPLATAHISSDSMSVDYESLSRARHMIVKSHSGLFDDENRARHLFWAGHGMMKTRQTTQGRRNLMEAVTLDFRPLYLVSLLLSLFGSTVYSTVYAAISRRRASSQASRSTE